MMRNDLLEGLVVGATIGLLVIAIRVLFEGGASLAQALVLVLAGVALCCCQIALSLRRPRRVPQRPEARPALPRIVARRRLSRHNPFAQELTNSWTGLDDSLTGESPADISPSSSDKLS